MLPVERGRFRGEQARRDRWRLADPLWRRRALVQLCREIYRRVRLARESTLSAGQRIPAPIPMNVAEKWLKQNLESRFPGRKLINTRLSNMTEDKPEQNRTKCQFRNQCSNGCSFGAYFSTQAVTLPAARATGRLTLQSDAVVTSLDYDPKAKRVTGVRYIDTKTGQAQSVQADLVFLCASAMASTQILLNSRPAGSDRSHFDTSGTLGRYVMDHIFRVGVDGEIGGMQEFIEYGRRPGASISRVSATSAATTASASSAAMAIRAAPIARPRHPSGSARR
ncbi:GMC family oxidoreductase N-terminal domain-containing protein [Sphingomonas aerolata]|uniref:GMC family oxidoreductase N-terminal domain-containing protein n=1 Tax=Sphingomonas aerolata TaxID=185951 RepID=UPI002FDFF388